MCQYQDKDVLKDNWHRKLAMNRPAASVKHSIYAQTVKIPEKCPTITEIILPSGLKILQRDV
jgi:hypothetical protein